MNLDLRDPVESVEVAIEKNQDLTTIFLYYLENKNEENIHILVCTMVFVLSMNVHADLTIENLWAKMIENCQNGFIVTQEEKELIFSEVQKGLLFVKNELELSPIKLNGNLEKSRRAFRTKVIVLVEVM